MTQYTPEDRSVKYCDTVYTTEERREKNFDTVYTTEERILTQCTPEERRLYSTPGGCTPERKGESSIVTQ